jgi:hypothetical protein
MAQLKIWMPEHSGVRGPYFGEGDLYMVGIYVMEFFNAVIKGTKVLDSCDYYFDALPSSIGERDLVCHLLAKQSRSIVANHTSNALGPGGSTFFSSKSKAVISEIYMTAVDGDANKSRLLANLIIHELMHNKIDARSSQDIVHRIVGGRVSKGNINASSTPSAADIAAMRARIADKVPQHLGNS